MTTKPSGCIIYCDSEGGPILRTVTGEDVARLEQEFAKLSYFADPHARGALGRWLTADEMIAQWATLAHKIDGAEDRIESHCKPTATNGRAINF